MNNDSRDIHQKWKDREAYEEAAKRIIVEEIPRPPPQQWVTRTNTSAEVV